jgi:nicotinamidase-related amidase
MTALHRSDIFLVVIDVQERLMPTIDQRLAVEQNIERLVRGCRILDVPALLTEQYVEGLGPTVEPVRRAFEETSGYEPIHKSSFSAGAAAEFGTAIRRLQKKHAVVAGVEAHVCVYQTVRDLLAFGVDVTIVADAISSRSATNKDIAVRRMHADGAKLSSTEMVLYELLGTAGTEEFRAILRLVK